MDKYIKVVFSVLIGLLISFAIYKYVEVNNRVYMVEIGVFKDYINAFKVSDMYNAYIKYDNGLYRVYCGIYNGFNLRGALSNLDNKGISYYIRR